MKNMDSSWDILKPLLYQEPLQTLNKLLPNIKYYPEKENIFRVFKTKLSDIKVVILGQDPYPRPGDAIGLSFVNGTDKIPPSLRIINQELEKEGFIDTNIHNWESQGVFLLNTALTVEAGNAGSHLNYWKNFTEACIRYISSENPCIWILWGRYAQQYEIFIKNPVTIDNNSTEDFIKDLPKDAGYNFILKSAHPANEIYSGGRGGFIGNNHFKLTNSILSLNKRDDIITW